MENLNELKDFFNASEEFVDLVSKYKEIERIYSNSMQAMNLLEYSNPSFSTDKYYIDSSSIVSTARII